jgi:hypothetical protein
MGAQACGIVSGFDDLDFSAGAGGSTLATCGNNSECSSGFCANGYCCDSACDGPCQQCDNSGDEGECQSYAAGTDPEEECETVCTGDSACAGPGEVLWTRTFGGDGDARAVGVDTGENGNVAVVGNFTGIISIDQDVGPIDNPTDEDDFFVASLNPSSGSLRWARTYGDAAQDTVTAVAVLPDSNDIIVGGTFMGELDFSCCDGILSANGGNQDMFLARLDSSSGDTIWSRSFGGDSTNEQLLDLAVDDDGDIIIVGDYRGALDLGGDALADAGVIAANVFVAKFDNEGNHLWSDGYGTANNTQTATKVSVRGAGQTAQILVAGEFGGTLAFGTGALSFAAVVPPDGFLVSLDGFGKAQWAFDIVGSSSPVLSALAIAPDGTGALAMSFSGQADIDGASWSTSTTDDTNILLAFVNAAGAPDGMDFGQAGADPDNDQRVRGVDFDSSGALVMVGDFNQSFTFGGAGDELPTVGGDDAYVVKLRSNFTHLWSIRWGFDGDQSALDVAVDTDDNAIVVGSFEQTLELADDALTSEGGTDVLIVKLAP